MKKKLSRRVFYILVFTCSILLLGWNFSSVENISQAISSPTARPWIDAGFSAPAGMEGIIRYGKP